MEKEKVKKSNVETTTLERVPPEEEKSWVDVALIQAGVFISVASIVVGGTLVACMSLSHAIISGFLGYALASLLAVVTGIIGKDIHVPTCVVTKSSFGESGSRVIVSSIFAIASIGWFAIQNAICGGAFAGFAETMGFHISTEVSSIIWGIIMLITAVIGIDSLKWLNRIAVPALVIIMAVGLIRAISEVGTGNLSAPVEQTMSIAQGTIMVVSYMGVTMTCAPDFTRYQKTRGGVWASTFVGILPAAEGLLIMGAVLAKLVGETDLTVVMCSIGMPILGSAVLILATWTTNTTNAWTAGINMVMLFKMEDNKRALVTAVAGIAGTILAVMGLLDHFNDFINFLGYLFVPVAGAMTGDYWVIRRGKAENWGFGRGFNLAGILSFIVGAALAVKVPSDIAILYAYFASIVVYVVIYKVLPKKPEEDLDGEQVVIK